MAYYSSMTAAEIIDQPTSLSVRIWRANAPVLALWLTYYIGVEIALMPFDTSIDLYKERFIPQYRLAICTFIVVCLLIGFFRYCCLANLPPKERWRVVTANVRGPRRWALAGSRLWPWSSRSWAYSRISNRISRT